MHDNSFVNFVNWQFATTILKKIHVNTLISFFIVPFFEILKCSTTNSLIAENFAEAFGSWVTIPCAGLLFLLQLAFRRDTSVMNRSVITDLLGWCRIFQSLCQVVGSTTQIPKVSVCYGRNDPSLNPIAYKLQIDLGRLIKKWVACTILLCKYLFWS